MVVSFGGDAWKTAIALDKESDDGHRVGDELRDRRCFKRDFNL